MPHHYVEPALGTGSGLVQTKMMIFSENHHNDLVGYQHHHNHHLDKDLFDAEDYEEKN